MSSRGNALLINVENESMTISVVSGRDSIEFGRHNNAMKWAKLGTVIRLRFESFSSSVRGVADDGRFSEEDD